MADKAKREKTASKVHVHKDGKEHRSAMAGEIRLDIKFVKGDKVLSVSRSDISDDVWECAGWHGIAQKIGDSYAGESGDAAYDEAEKMLEQLTAGNWVTESKSTGPRIGLLVEAIVAAKVAAGMEYDEAAIKLKLADKDYAKSVKANEQVNAHYKRLEAERAAARSKEAQAAAKGADTAGLEDI